MTDGAKLKKALPELALGIFLFVCLLLVVLIHHSPGLARYAYAPGGGDVAVRFDHDESTRTVSIAFVDSGVPFDPLQKPDPDVARAVDEREVGGLGIFLVRKTMDSVDYRREGGQNILTIRKKI